MSHKLQNLANQLQICLLVIVPSKEQRPRHYINIRLDESEKKKKSSSIMVAESRQSLTPLYLRTVKLSWLSLFHIHTRLKLMI
jgi:hypothetical protein